MLLKKTLKYKKYNISFSRIKMNEKSDPRQLFLGCRGCGFLNIDACILKYEKGIDIQNLKCSFGFYIDHHITGDVLYKYVAKENPST